MFITTLLLLFAQTPPAVPVPAANQKPLFAAEKWYQDAKGEEKVYEGVLEINPGEGRIGLPTRFNSFRLTSLEDGRPVIRQIHANGKDHLLSSFIGHNVKLTAKLVESGVNGELRAELWPAKVDVFGLAPTGVIAEWKILARTSNFTSNQVRAQPMPGVIRTGKDLANFMNMGDGEAAATTRMNTYLQPTKLDWSKHMLLNISAGGRTGFIGQIRVTKITYGEKGLDVHWKVDAQAGGGPRVAETILVNRFEGDVRFLQEGSSRSVIIPGPGKQDETPTKTEAKPEPAKR